MHGHGHQRQQHCPSEAIGSLVHRAAAGGANSNRGIGQPGRWASVAVIAAHDGMPHLIHYMREMSSAAAADSVRPPKSSCCASPDAFRPPDVLSPSSCVLARSSCSLCAQRNCLRWQRGTQMHPALTAVLLQERTVDRNIIQGAQLNLEKIAPEEEQCCVGLRRSLQRDHSHWKWLRHACCYWLGYF